MFRLFVIYIWLGLFAVSFDFIGLCVCCCLICGCLVFCGCFDVWVCLCVDFCDGFYLGLCYIAIRFDIGVVLVGFVCILWLYTCTMSLNCCCCFTVCLGYNVCC